MSEGWIDTFSSSIVGNPKIKIQRILDAAEHRIWDQELSLGYSKALLGKLLLKESIEDLAIHEHYEQRVLDLEYIFQQGHSDSKISDSQHIQL